MRYRAAIAPPSTRSAPGSTRRWEGSGLALAAGRLAHDVALGGWLAVLALLAFIELEERAPGRASRGAGPRRLGLATALRMGAGVVAALAHAGLAFVE